MRPEPTHLVSCLRFVNSFPVLLHNYNVAFLAGRFGFDTLVRMAEHLITLNLSDEAWSALLRASQGRQEAPEIVATKILSTATADPLLSLFGCLSYPKGDISDNHDEYLGAAILGNQDRA
jgi:hypothetical protein